MPVNGIAIGYAVAGGLILYSGIKGSSLSDTAKAVLTGNLTLANTEAVGNASESGTGTTVSSGVSGANYLTIAKYLVSNGYSKSAAAGIAGCVAGESSGNPEAVGAGSYGIIQEQGPEYAALVTGNANADLDTQLRALVAYNNAQGAGLVSMLNQIPDPVQAAYFYSENFERPKVKDSDVVASVATSVYSQLSKAA